MNTLKRTIHIAVRMNNVAISPDHHTHEDRALYYGLSWMQACAMCSGAFWKESIESVEVKK